MTDRILITGGNGFIGKAFLKSTSSSNAEVISLSGPGYAYSDMPGLDLTDKARVRAVLREIRPTHILNFASRGVTRDQSNLSQLLEVNTIGALNIVDGLIEEGIAPHTYCFGTAYEFADAESRLNETSQLDPKSPYAISKTTLYYALKQYTTGAPVTFLRLFNIFGIGEPANRLIPFITNKAIENKDIPLTGGEQLRDFMFIEDLVALLWRLISLSMTGQIGFRTLNIGTGQGISLKSFIGYVADALRQHEVSPRLSFGALPYRPQDPMHCVADNTRMLQLLGNVSFTNLPTAIEKTVQALYEF
jgi:nucleoside-diphosphate-sugar epimerase